ncbi:potassium channel family protein [Kitasatospora sp. NBC_01287]|uniref:potassium channel family protein n=1 Tax=Kitasatospora sp. NBC_01287 TaxID=2903573 RepID=UPI0022505373|nr:potassium channel family protein [Kitasatospora sp. NBC_01287]MCX4747626.1 potassium channel family protein [Kitasatospora sp. NBC_01287]
MKAGEADARIVLPARRGVPPLRQVGLRVAIALAVLVATTLLVYLDRAGYHDNAHDTLSLLDAAYYATVTLSTTGYGDITPVSDGARLANILVITPLRVVFLIILVGTTLEVLAERTRRQWRIGRWRSSVHDHAVIVGYGTKGRSAVQTLLGQGLGKERIVVVDPQRRVVEQAALDGLTGVVGDATRTDTLLRAEVPKAAQVVVATERDDTAVLVALTVRQLNRAATLVAAVREDENAPLLRQSGADVVVTSSSSAGRLLGMSMLSPNAGAVMEDLLTYGKGLNVVERPVTRAEAGQSPRACPDLVVAVVRGRRVLDFADPEAAELRLTDRVITIQRSTPVG